MNLFQVSTLQYMQHIPLKFKILRTMKYADLGLAVSLGFAIGIVYSDILTSAVMGEFSTMILSLLYLTMCVLYPMYGYVPEVDREGALILMLITMLVVYVLPVFAILSLGLLISLRSIEAVFQPTIKYYRGAFGFPIMSGFILGTQFGDVDSVKFSLLFLPSLVFLLWVMWSGFGEAQYVTADPTRVYSRDVLLGLHLAKNRQEPEVRSRGG